MSCRTVRSVASPFYSRTSGRLARVIPDASFPTHSIGMIDEIIGGRMLPMTRAGLGAATTELSR